MVVNSSPINKPIKVLQTLPDSVLLVENTNKSEEN